jgi:hypothetical protein
MAWMILSAWKSGGLGHAKRKGLTCLFSATMAAQYLMAWMGLVAWIGLVAQVMQKERTYLFDLCDYGCQRLDGLMRLVA